MAVTGLDVGHRTVRACVIERSGKTLRLRACGEVSRLDAMGEPKPLSSVVAELDAIVSFSGPVVCAVSDISALVRFVATLPLPPDRLARLLRLELSQHVDGGGDLAADTLVVPIPSDELMHCCFLAQPAQVYGALVDLREAGVRSPQVHFGPAAAYNATLPLPPVRDSALALLVDIGSATTGITLFGEDRMLACRQVPVGGDAFTDALVAAGRDRAGAEKSKRVAGAAMAPTINSDDPFAKMLDAGLTRDPTPATPQAALADPSVSSPDSGISSSFSSVSSSASSSSASFDSGDHDEIVITDLPHGDEPAAPAVSATQATGLPTPISAAVTRPVEPTAPVSLQVTALDPDLTRAAEALFGQIVSSLTWFKAQLKLKGIDLKMVCLAGGGAALPGLAAYLSRRLSMPVQAFDPFAGIEAAAKPEHAHEYTTATGLALSHPGFRFRHAVSLDLRPDTLVRRELWRSRLAWPFVAAACLAFAAVFACLTLYGQHEAERASLANYAAYQSSYDALKKKLDEREAEKAALDDDLRAIASRIYAGRDLLYTIRALKERTKDSSELWVTELETQSVGKDADLASEAKRMGDVVRVETNRDTAIDRGAVKISGRVKFASASDDRLRLEFLNKWRQWIEEWTLPTASATGEGGSRLFTRSKEFVIDPTHKDEAALKANTSSGEFPWVVTFYFAPTDLRQVTSVRTVPPAPALGSAPPVGR